MIKLRVWSSMACGKPMWNRGSPNLDLDSSVTRSTFHYRNRLLRVSFDRPSTRPESWIVYPFPIQQLRGTMKQPARTDVHVTVVILWGQMLHLHLEGRRSIPRDPQKKFPNLNCSVAMDTLLDEWKRLNNTVDFNHNVADYLRNMDEVPTENENRHEPPSTLLGVHPKCPLKNANYSIFHG